MGTKQISRKVLLLIRAFFIFLFTYTAVSKFIYLMEFEAQLVRFPLLAPYNHFISITIPAFELTIACLWLFRATTYLAIYSSLVLLSLYTVYILYVLEFSNSIPCSCGGIISSLSWNGHLLMNIYFILLFTLGLYLLKIINKNRHDYHTT